MASPQKTTPPRWGPEGEASREERADDQRSTAVYTVLLLLLIVALLAVSLPYIGARSITEPLRIMLMVFAGSLPLILYQSFARGRLTTVFNEFRQNLRRLGFPENASIYQDKFAENYGRTPRAPNAQEEEDVARRYSPLSEIPIVIATLFSILGWIITFYPDDPSAHPFAPNANVMVYGFLGAYIFGLGSLVRQYVADDLQPRYYASLTNRYLTVFVLSWLVGMAGLLVPSEAGQQAVLLVAFFTGLFPTEILRVGWRKVVQWIGSDSRGLDESFPLNDLDGLNAFQEDRLSLEGIENLQNMACANLVDLMLKTRYPVEQLVDWIDQALLFLHARDLLRVFQMAGLRTATDFLDMYQPDALPSGRLTAYRLVDEDRKARRLALADLLKRYITEDTVKNKLAPDFALKLEQADLLTLLEATATSLVNAPNMFHVQYWRQHEYEALPEDVERERTRADLRMIQGLPMDAIEIYDQILTRFPNAANTLLYRGLAHFQMRNFTRAISDYTAAIELSANQWENAATAQMELGRAYREMDDPQAARAQYELALEGSPNFLEAHQELAYLQLTRLKLPAEAIVHLEILIKAGYKKAEMLANRGLARYELWKQQSVTSPQGTATSGADISLLNQAESDLNQALRLEPGLIAAYLNLAVVQVEIKRPDLAIATLARALPQLESQRSALAAGRTANASGDRSANAQSVSDNAYRVRLQRGNLYFDAANYAAASEDYRAAAELAPYDVAALYNLGKAQQWLGQHAEAIVSFREVVRLKPGHAPAQQALGDLLTAARKYSEAEKAYADALRLAREVRDLMGQAQVHFSLGKLYRLMTGREVEARRELERAQKLVGELKKGLADPQQEKYLDELHIASVFELAMLRQPTHPEEAASLFAQSAMLYGLLDRKREAARAYLALGNTTLRRDGNGALPPSVTPESQAAARKAYENAQAMLNDVFQPGNADDAALDQAIQKALADVS